MALLKGVAVQMGLGPRNAWTKYTVLSLDTEEGCHHDFSDFSSKEPRRRGQDPLPRPHPSPPPSPSRAPEKPRRRGQDHSPESSLESRLSHIERRQAHNTTNASDAKLSILTSAISAIINVLCDLHMHCNTFGAHIEHNTIHLQFPVQ